MKDVILKNVGLISVAIGLLAIATAIHSHNRYQFHRNSNLIIDTHTGAVSTFADARRIGR